MVLGTIAIGFYWTTQNQIGPMNLLCAPNTSQRTTGIVRKINRLIFNIEISVWFLVHVWDYRRLLVNKIGITFDHELSFSTERLNINFSNYSSWHYRSTLRKLDSDCVGRELDLVKNAVFTDPGDSSAWFYLRYQINIQGESTVWGKISHILFKMGTRFLSFAPA